MNYCTLDDLVELYSEKTLIQLTDRVNRPAQNLDAALIERAIEDAESEIDLHLEGRYQLPLPSVPRVLKRIAGSLAYANLHTNLGDTHPALRAAEHSRRMLSGIAKGTLSIGLDVTGNPVQIANTVQISAGRNDFGGNW